MRAVYAWFVGTCVVLVASSVALAGGPNPATGQSDTPPTASAPVSDPSAAAPDAEKEAGPPLQPVPNYSGSLWERPALTGDWGGSRQWLVDHGVKFDLQVIQYLQSNTYGGRNTAGALEYSGTADFSFNFDFQRMGLWPGGFARIRGETTFGQSVNGNVGSISAPNFNALLPAPNDPGLTTLTEYWVAQFVSEKLGFIAGQIDLTALPGQNRFAGDRYGQFMNTSFWQNPVAFTTVPYSTMAAGAIYAPTKWFDGATLVCDPYGTPTRSGFYEAFHGPQAISIIQALNFHIKPFGLPGTQRLNFSYSNRPRYALEDIDRLLLSGAAAPSFDRLNLGFEGDGIDRRLRRIAARTGLSRLLEPEQRESDGWAFWYDFDQYVYTELEDPTQGWGVFGRFGWSPGVTNPVEAFYSLGVGGKGVVPARDNDRFGVGYYMLNLSDELPELTDRNAEQGIELFYNIEVTPWLHITPDIQVIIHPGGATGARAREPAIVCGIRAQIRF